MILRSKRAIFFLVGIFLGISIGAFIFLGGAKRISTTFQAQPPQVGKKAADFKLNNLDGSAVSLSQYHGNPVILNFWATWCEPCKQEMPLLESYYQKSLHNLVVLGINDEEPPDKVKAFVSEYRLTFPILLDTDGAIANLFFVHGYPTSLFIDADGVLRAQHIGTLSEDILQNYLILIGADQ
jgi:cytochrome c biogenesis protein CcmG/thiol:disulfide interchange protein DsbE